MDINRSLRLAIDTGKVLLGSRQVERALKKKRVKLIIISSNLKMNFKNELEKYSKVPVFQFNGNNHELGSACGKPFPISSLAVLDSGDSNIMDLVQKP